MIIYDLVCDSGHQFEGWFQSAEDFSRQQNKDLVCCPVCNGKQVRKLPSASYVQRSRNSPNRPSLSRAGSAQTTADQNQAAWTDDITPAELQKMVTRLRDFVVNETEDVGQGFAEESRKMHHGEVAHRNIRGEATIDEVVALNEEGIQAVPVPSYWVDKKQLN